MLSGHSGDPGSCSNTTTWVARAWWGLNSTTSRWAAPRFSRAVTDRPWSAAAASGGARPGVMREWNPGGGSVRCGAFSTTVATCPSVPCTTMTAVTPSGAPVHCATAPAHSSAKYTPLPNSPSSTGRNVSGANPWPHTSIATSQGPPQNSCIAGGAAVLASAAADDTDAACAWNASATAASWFRRYTAARVTVPGVALSNASVAERNNGAASELVLSSTTAQGGSVTRVGGGKPDWGCGRAAASRLKTSRGGGSGGAPGTLAAPSGAAFERPPTPAPAPTPASPPAASLRS